MSAPTSGCEQPDIRAILTYEEANKNRQGVLTAARNRLTNIARDITGLT